ncbi:hypothetical protein CTI12_AA262240 [Artemisia annua]|uniref:Helitron helicase-like domain-containing protein n=1 Tax=Artemisia annua TaxID=35608 RepID=A0A2U1MM57_ARTAN|nr:hypothetical protein CTI12_AA262240 [Artemisia annua]
MTTAAAPPTYSTTLSFTYNNVNERSAPDDSQVVFQIPVSSSGVVVLTVVFRIVTFVDVAGTSASQVGHGRLGEHWNMQPGPPDEYRAYSHVTVYVDIVMPVFGRLCPEYGADPRFLLLYIYDTDREVDNRLCPEYGADPRFLLLYIYDTDREVDNRLNHFRDGGTTNLRRDIVEGLIHVLDEHNALVQLFRTARDKLQEADVPEFKVRLYGVVGSAQHELPTADCIGAIVFEDGPQTESEFDIVIESHSGELERVNKLHPCYMAFQLPLLFIFGEQSYHTGLRLLDVCGADTDKDKRKTYLSRKSFRASLDHYTKALEIEMIIEALLVESVNILIENHKTRGCQNANGKEVG